MPGLDWPRFHFQPTTYTHIPRKNKYWCNHVGATPLKVTLSLSTPFKKHLCHFSLCLWKLVFCVSGVMFLLQGKKNKTLTLSAVWELMYIYEKKLSQEKMHDSLLAWFCSTTSTNRPGQNPGQLSDELCPGQKTQDPLPVVSALLHLPHDDVSSPGSPSLSWALRVCAHRCVCMWPTSDAERERWIKHDPLRNLSFWCWDETEQIPSAITNQRSDERTSGTVTVRGSPTLFPFQAWGPSAFCGLWFIRVRSRRQMPAMLLPGCQGNGRGCWGQRLQCRTWPLKALTAPKVHTPLLDPKRAFRHHGSPPCTRDIIRDFS